MFELTVVQQKLLAIVSVIAIVEILKFYIKKYFSKTTDETKLLRVKTYVFILSVFITTIPVIFLFENNSIKEFLANYSEMFIQIQGIYNIIKNIFRLPIFDISEVGSKSENNKNYIEKNND